LQHRRRTVARLGHVESLRSSFSENLHIPLHGDHRYSEGLHDLLRLHRAVDDHLAGEHAEAIHIVLAVVKHRQVTVDVIDSARFLFQLQLPIFPAGITEINSQIAVEKKASTVYYIYGHLPVFHHREDDVDGFRMFTSQMIVNGTVKPKEIVQAFGVPMITVKRYVKVFRERGAQGFYVAKPRHSSASVLKGEVLERAQQLLEEGRSVPEVARELEILANTLHKAIRAGRLSQQKKTNPRAAR